MDSLRIRTEQLLDFGEKVALLLAHLPDVGHPAQDAVDLLDQVLALLDRQHIIITC